MQSCPIKHPVDCSRTCLEGARAHGLVGGCGEAASGDAGRGRDLDVEGHAAGVARRAGRQVLGVGLLHAHQQMSATRSGRAHGQCYSLRVLGR